MQVCDYGCSLLVYGGNVGLGLLIGFFINRASIFFVHFIICLENARNNIGYINEYSMYIYNRN